MTAAPRDPYPAYAWLRHHEPVHYRAADHAWLVTRYEDVAALLVDSRLTSRISPSFFAGLAPSDRRRFAGLERFFETWLALSDGDAHTRLRRAISPAFIAPSQRLAGGLTALAQRVAADHVFDSPAAVRRYALDVAAEATLALVGFRPDERASVLAWSDILIRFMSAPMAGTDRATEAATAVGRLRQRVLAGPHERPVVGLPVLVPATGLGDDERVAVVAQLLAGGHRPLAQCVASALLAPVPDTKPAELDEPAARRVVEEALRFDAPFHLAPRIATASIGLGACVVAPGDRVLLALASANRDEAAFTDADRFRPERQGPPHLAFGRGPHRCLAGAVARTILTAAVRAAWQPAAAGRRTSPVRPGHAWALPGIV